MKQTLCSVFACFCLVVNCADGANKPLNIEYLSSESPRSTTCRTYPMSVTPRTHGSKRTSVPIMDDSMPVNILSCSGGGSRGVILGRIIEKIEEKIKKGIASVFEVIGGTSTGAIAAAAVSTPHHNSLDGPFSGRDIVELYKKEAHVIFSDSKRGLFPTLFNASSYSSDGRKAVFKKYFDGISLSDITSTLIIPYYDLKANQIDFFKSRQAKQNDFANYSIVDVLLGTTAAPTYFEPHQIGSCNGDEKTACDGGVFANNPAFFSLLEAIKAYPDASSYFLLSLGTGKSERKHYQNISLFNLMQVIPDILISAPDDMLNKYAIMQCGYNFKNPVYICELNVDIPDELYTMDNSSDEYMQQLIDIVDQDNALKSKIDHVCDIFLQEHKFVEPKTKHINENNVFVLEDISDFAYLSKSAK